jgi:PAS domain S-box-containing protein
MTYATARDITERMHMEAELRASEAHYRLLTEDVSDVVWKLGPDYRFTYISPADERLRGYRADEVIGSMNYEMMSEEGVAVLTEKIRHRKESEKNGEPTGPVTFEVQQRCKDERVIWTEVLSTPERDADGTIVGYHGISRDITERKRSIELEKQLLHAQKLESLGVLAGGIAHDFNNILMVIIGNSNLAMMDLNEESPAAENLHRIEQAVARAADLTKQMLAYSGKGKFVIEDLDLNHLLEKMLPLLEVSTSKKAALRLRLHQPLPLVKADATQMHQIVMNLVINASEAIEDNSGVIDIITGCLVCDQNYLKDALLGENLCEGLYVYLEIADTGYGMSMETIAKLFDPFFTTKFTGRGLGMAAVLGIVKGHKGAIKVNSELGKGTTFKILLPASERTTNLHNHDNHDKHRDDWQGSGTVLLVDDEEAVRDIGVEMLEMLGFSPITANDGQEAISLFKETPDIQFVILDLTMPRMGGEQCFRELRKLNPMVKVIMASGYNEQEVTQMFVGEGLSGFIQKPYNLSNLRGSIKSIV